MVSTFRPTKQKSDWAYGALDDNSRLVALHLDKREYLDSLYRAVIEWDAAGYEIIHEPVSTIKKYYCGQQHKPQ